MIALRVLPPAGARIPFQSLLCALKEGFSPNGTSRSLVQQLTDETGLRHWVLTNSGRSALSVTFLALRSLNPERDEVIIPAYTSYSVPAAVVRAGLRVRLCDIETETLGMAPSQLVRAITARTLCVVPNHLYGVPCQIKALCEIARHQQVPVVEDAAQALGVRCMGVSVGVQGDAVIFSLSRGKSLPAAGGGIIGTNDSDLARRCERILSDAAPAQNGHRGLGVRPAVEAALMALFIRPSLYWLPDALPLLNLGASIFEPVFAIGPMERFQAALATELLPGLEKLRAIRENNGRSFRRAFEDIENIRVLWSRSGNRGGFLRLPVLLKDRARRDRVLDHLKQLGLGAAPGYPLPLSELAELKSQLAAPDAEFPVAKSVSERLLTLPTHPWVKARDTERIVRIFRQWA